MLGEIATILSKHRLTYADRVFRCTCLERVYSRYGKDRAGALEIHEVHVAQQLKAAGMIITPDDPREAFRARAQELGRNQSHDH